jgi:hypothetical protein
MLNGLLEQEIFVTNSKSQMDLYNDIISLRSVSNNTERGYKFEQLIREIQPWDRKPAIVASLASEQLDGVFLWKEQAYLIESKAKIKPITPGSSDWEDFELKIRKRRNSVIGLFCSLYPVSNNVYNHAEQLNREGHYVIVLAGKFWDDLNKYKLPISDILTYMNLYNRIKFIAKVPELKIINEWCYNKESVNKEIGNLCRKNSSLFLRRYKSPSHDAIYIKRDIDKQIENYANDIKPSAIKKAKEKPKQICLIRDFSGSGKTTLSLELSTNNIDSYFGTGVTANEPDIDIKIASFFSSLGENRGILKLISANKPIVYVIDSLDEANFDLHGKQRQVRAILKIIDELNKAAEDVGLWAFPALFVFTVREDYWRDWESLFEGQKRNDINRRISSFTTAELPEALTKYSQCYEYTIINNLTNDSKRALSIPINLLIFSETYRYQGEIYIQDIWEGNVIDSYFVRRQDDIHKRYIPGFTSSMFMQLISSIAFSTVKSRSNSTTKKAIEENIRNDFSLILPYLDEIIHALISESILIRDAANSNLLMFRHSRFIEFLLAYHIVSTVERQQNLSLLDYFAQISFDSGVVLMFRVHDDIRHIGRSRFNDIFNDIEDYYSKSNVFMLKKISRLRSDLCSNNRTNPEDMALILKNANSGNTNLTNAFYVIAAKFNNQPKETILNMFKLSFLSDKNSSDRYKLIIKLGQHNLLINETTLNCLLKSSSPKDWEVYLGLIIINKLGHNFKELWTEAGGSCLLNSIIADSSAEDWSQVKKLIASVLNDEKFIFGDF